MAERLANKVALITGAGSGLGREMALLFAREGASVVINDIDEEAGERTASEIGSATFVAGDVSNDASVARLFDSMRETHARLDVSVHNAGIMDPRDEGVVDTPLDVWDRVIAINLSGVFLCCRHAVPLMLESEGNSSLINIASFVALMGAGALGKSGEQEAALVGLGMPLHAEHPAAVGRLDRLDHAVRDGASRHHESLAQLGHGLVVMAAHGMHLLARRGGR